MRALPVTESYMATSDELRDQLEEEGETDAEKQRRIQEAADARQHAEEYQNDSTEANVAADEAEANIENPG